MQTDALVVGAGPAGSAAARLLAQAGWSVTLLEKAEFPRRKVCGEFISAATMPILAYCGVDQQVMALAGPPVARIAAYAGDKMPASCAAASAWGRALGREHLDTLLRNAAVQAGAHLHQPAELTAMQRRGNAHICTVRTETGEVEIAARIVIAANGSWSSKGPLATPAHNAAPGDLFAFKAHFRGSALPDDLMPLLAFCGGYGGMVHSDDGRVSLSCCIRRDVLSRARALHGGKAAQAVLAHIQAGTRGVRRALEDASLEGAFLSAGPIQPGIRPRHGDGIFFTGNSAGEAHPIIAEGIGMAIQSSWLLSRFLTAPTMSDAALAQAGADYARAWRRKFAPRIHAAALFARLAMRDETRALCLGLIARFPQLLAWGAKVSGKHA